MSTECCGCSDRMFEHRVIDPAELCAGLGKIAAHPRLPAAKVGNPQAAAHLFRLLI